MFLDLMIFVMLSQYVYVDGHSLHVSTGSSVLGVTSLQVLRRRTT